MAPGETQGNLKAGPPDGGWGWCVVFGSFLVHVIAGGLSYTQGVLLREVRDHFGGTRQAMGFVAYGTLVMAFMLSPLNGTLVNKFGCRLVGIAGGIIFCLGFVLSSFAQSFNFLLFSHVFITAWGLGIMYIPAVVIVASYFEKKRAFAFGLAASGAGIGTLILAPLIQVLIDVYSWRGAMLITGGIALNTVVSASLYRPVDRTKTTTCSPAANVEMKELPVDTGISEHQSENLVRESSSLQEMEASCITTADRSEVETATEEKGDADTTTVAASTPTVPKNKRLENFKKVANLSIFKQKAFLCWFFSGFFCNMSLPTTFTFLPDMVVLAGHEPASAAFLISLIGITNTVFRMVLGFIADKSFVNKVMVYAGATSLIGIIIALFPISTNYGFLAFNAAMYGMFFGQRVGLMSVVMSELLGVENLATGLGFYEMFGAIGTLVGSFFCGRLFDQTGSYTATFVVSGIIMGIGSMCQWLIMCTPEYKRVQRARIEKRQSPTLDEQ